MLNREMISCLRAQADSANPGQSFARHTFGAYAAMGEVTKMDRLLRHRRALHLRTICRHPRVRPAGADDEGLRRPDLLRDPRVT